VIRSNDADALGEGRDVDDGLRSAIDGLIARGGRLVVRPPDAAAPALTLDQPGGRFGILEVHGRLAVDAADRERMAALIDAGWSDPSVTRRGDREIRIRPVGVDGGQIALTRTWRVPPTLASEIAAEVLAAVGAVISVELSPLAGRHRPDDPSPRAPGAIPARAEIDPEFERATEAPTARMLGRSLPAPLRALTLIVVTVAIAVAWTAIIRDAGRSSAGPSGEAGAASQLTGDVSSDPPTGGPTLGTEPTPDSEPTPDPRPTATPTPVQVGIAAHASAASSQRVGSTMGSATDGDLATAWRPQAGFPQWLEIRLDRIATVSTFELVITQAEPGSATHVIEVAGPDQPLQVVGTIERFTDDGEPILVRPPAPIAGIERVRIETIAGPLDVGWYEVIVH
jgi:hypothetical protein